jgi:zinc protease
MSWKIIIIACLLCLGFAPSAFSAVRANPLPEVKHEIYTLSNGLTVILVQDHSLPIVGVNVNYKVGSKNERPGKTGFAHLFEHMMFQGSKHWDKNYFVPLQEVGAFVNGATNTDRTRYLEVVPAAYLERALWLEADRMGFLLDALTKERLANQISVVQNERRQSYENRPYGLVREKMSAVLYPPEHPYHWPTIGSMEDIAAASVDDVKVFFRAYYTPNNASLCIAGDFDPAEAKRLVEKQFAGLPPGPPVTKVGRWVPALPGEVTLDIQDRVQLPRTAVAWHTVPVYDEDEAALDAFGRILGGGRTSRLYKRLVYDLQIAQDASAYNSSQQIAGTFGMSLTPRPGHTLAEVEAEAFKVLQEALEKGVTPEEMDRTVNAITSDFVQSMQTVGGFSGLSDRMNEYVHYLDKPDMFRWDLQRTLDLTPEKVHAAARKFLGPNRLVARVTPAPKAEAGASEVAKSVDRNAMPGPAPQKAFALPPRQTFALKNGLKVVLVEHRKVPAVALDLVVRGGSTADPEGKDGLAMMTVSMLDEGAAGKTSIQIADALEGLGAELNLSADLDSVSANLTSLKSNLVPSLGILADVVLRPDFPAEELERQRKSRLVSFAQSEDQPEYLASLALNRTLFAGTPYGHLSRGDRKGVQSISVDDLLSYWARRFVPSNAFLVVAGDTTRAEIEPLLEKTFGGWSGTPVQAAPFPPVKPHGPRAVYLVDKPGSAQSVILCGLVAGPRNTPDYAAQTLLNAILGGQFGSRINLNLREDKGYTYGARTSFSLSKESGYFLSTAPVASAVTAPALKEMLGEMDGILGLKPATEAEMDATKGFLVGGYPRGFETTGDIAGRVSAAVLYGLPDDALETLPTQIQALTPPQVQAAAKAYLKPENLAVVVVGDKAAILPDLRKLNLGPIVELDKEGKRVGE